MVDLSFLMEAIDICYKLLSTFWGIDHYLGNDCNIEL